MTKIRPAAMLAVGCLFFGCAHTTEGTSGAAQLAESTVAAPTDPLSNTFGELIESITRVDRAMRASSAYGSDAEKVATYQHLLRSLIHSIEEGAIQDADFPYFQTNDFWIRQGGDNPDQRYSISPIRGGVNYRIWGHIGSARRIEVQINAGMPWDGSGRSVGYLPFEEIDFEDDGSFEVWISLEKRSGNWIPSAEDATTVFVRQLYDDWSDGDIAEVHIDRVGAEGDRQAPTPIAEMEARIRSVAKALEASALGWGTFVEKRYLEGVGPNRISPLIDTFAFGGVRGRWMSNGTFDLPPGKAFLIRAPRTNATTMGIQLTDLWFASLEYANRVSSLNAVQSKLSPDDAYYFVISREDPGHANWLSPGDLERGVILMRYDGALGEIPSDQHPTTELIDLSQIKERIPGFERVDETERAETRASRRQHIQRRSGR